MDKLTNALAARFASPARSTRLTVVLGRWLGLSFTVCFLTGLFSHGLQDPPSWMFFPTSPVWIYQLTQGIHVTTGIAAIPLLLAKLWSVYPELLKWPPVKSVTHALERAPLPCSSLLAPAADDGPDQHLQVVPVAFPVPSNTLLVGLGDLGFAAAPYRRETSTDHGALAFPFGHPGPSGCRRRFHSTVIDDGAAPPMPGRWSRRAFLAAVGVTTGAVVLTTAGQSFSWLDPLNLFAPRKMGTGPQAVPVNRTAADAKVADLAGAKDWALTVSHQDIRRILTLAELQALPQYEHELPIACVEGWSQTATWRGVRIRDLVASVGASPSSSLRVTSLEPEGAYRTMDMPAAYAQDERTLVALELNGQTLDLDHGYPARIIAPGRPGVLQTKWLHTVEVL